MKQKNEMNATKRFYVYQNKYNQILDFNFKKLFINLIVYIKNLKKIN